MKRQFAKLLSKYLLNPFTRAVAGYIPFWALLETTGRKSGKLRRTPVGNGLIGNTFWIVAEHGRRADYVVNIAANPRVRVRVGGRWRTGRAYAVPEDDTRRRQRQLRKVNAALVRLVGTDLLTVRIDLDP